MYKTPIYRYRTNFIVSILLALILTGSAIAQPVQVVEKLNGVDVVKGHLLVTSPRPLSKTEIETIETNVNAGIEPIVENDLYLLESKDPQVSTEQFRQKVKELLVNLDLFGDEIAKVIIEPDYVVEAEKDPIYKSAAEKLCPVNSLWGYEKIKVTQAMSKIGNGTPTVVAVLDYGFHKHKDLQRSLWKSPVDFKVSVRHMRDVRCAKGTNGVNFTARTRSEVCRPEEESNSDHGTAVAGIIGASGDLKGVNQNTKLLFVKVLSMNSGNTQWALSSTLAAWNFIIKLNRQLREMDQPEVFVVNHSFGFRRTPGQLETLERNIRWAGRNGLLLVASAGNNGANLDTVPVIFGINEPNLITVAASDQNDVILPGSNRGPRIVDVIAPGLACSTTTGNGYCSFGQTSAAAAYVSGAASLIRSACPHLSNIEVKRYLEEGSFNHNTLRQWVEKGRIDVFESIRLCQANKNKLFNANAVVSGQ